MDNVSIKLKVGGVEIPSHPVFGDDVKLKFSKEENQVFLRSKIDGKIKFTGEDFDFIASCSHDTTFTLEVYRGASLFGSGTFLKSDCTLNYDDRACEVKLTVTDRYEEFLSKYDNKYNLVQLAPQIQALGLTLRPIIQMYVRGDSKITNIYGGMYFEQDCQMISVDRDLEDTYKFYDVGPLANIEISSIIAGRLPDGVVGRYSMTKSITSAYIKYWHESGDYYIEAIVMSGGGFHELNFLLYAASDTEHALGIASINSWHDTDDYALTFTLTGTNPPDAANGTYHKDGELFGRILLPKTTGDQFDYERPENDIVENDDNYPYVRPSGSGDYVPRMRMIWDTTATPTEWGQKSAGQYFQAPELTSEEKSNGDVAIPVGWSFWNRMSTFLVMDNTLRTAYNAWNLEYTLKDAFPLWSAIAVLLSKMGLSTTFANSDNYSKFFFSFNRTDVAIVNAPRINGREVFITPITNVKKTKYEQAAQRGDITLKQILDMCRNVYQCYWFLDDSDRLRIEHISFFKHGRRYVMGTSYPDIDVSAMKDMPNGLSWAFGTNEADHDRGRCPSRYEFEWGDECTEQFNGEAIDIEDKYVSGDKKEKVNVANFTADIDYTVIKPSGVSDDIYALIEANASNHKVPTPNIRLANDTPIYAMQNGYLSFLHTERNYWTFDLGGWRAKAGPIYLDVKDVRRFAKQSLTFPLLGSNKSPFDVRVIKTGLGIGDLNEMDVNADTLVAKSKVYLETGIDYSLYVELTKQGDSHGTSVWVIHNNSHFFLRVKWLNPSSGTITSSLVYPESYVMTTMGQVKPEILSVSLNESSVTFVTPVYLANGGQMDVYQYSDDDEATIQFIGNNLNGRDWGYVQVRSGDKRVQITIQASSESGYDKGYVANRPFPVAFDISSGSVLKMASGTEQQVYTVQPHTTFFIGYSKDVSATANNDTMTFMMQEIP